MLAMSKRILAAILWFYTGWYAGAMVAELVGISPVFGPILGATAAALIAGDPRRIIWKRPEPARAAASPAAEALPEAV
jgi:hypothetical protein